MTDGALPDHHRRHVPSDDVLSIHRYGGKFVHGFGAVLGAAGAAGGVVVVVAGGVVVSS